MTLHAFKDRAEAGRMLAAELSDYKNRRPLVLALPRGGVPVGFEIARALNCPLDTAPVRKLGTPGNPELGMGAIAPEHTVVMNETLVNSLGVSDAEVAAVVEREEAELERRAREYRSGEFAGGKKFDVVILVDDGLATGVTARAAIEYARPKFQPRELVFAAPVGAADSIGQLETLADRVVVPFRPAMFMAVGQWYDDFPQTADAEVIRLLEEANKDRRRR